MDRFNPHKVIGTFYLLAGVFAYAVGQSLGNITLLATLVLIAGMCVNGAQSAMPSLAARFYPTQGRATGVSWMLGIGRFGAILGAWMGATLLGLGWNFEQVLTALVIPAALATTAVVMRMRPDRDNGAGNDVFDGGQLPRLSVDRRSGDNLQ
jgi:AAHS family 4-hydroxybenzoate transporter-like MFS transporter